MNEGKRGESVKTRLQWASFLPAKWVGRVFPSISDKFCGGTLLAFQSIFTRNHPIQKWQNMARKRATNIRKKAAEKSGRLTKKISSSTAFTEEGGVAIITLNL
ncbi:MAG TPA: hypothetical protein H9844_08420 [Candidatus Evtepia faecigallinarum]|nr:hypothetical protein [Candidatus Evtepia faecigallinarum]